MRLVLALLLICIGKGKLNRVPVAMIELPTVYPIGVQGQCAGGLWPITDTTIGSLAVSWRYFLASNTVQFIIQGSVVSLSLSNIHPYLVDIRSTRVQH